MNITELHDTERVEERGKLHLIPFWCVLTIGVFVVFFLGYIRSRQSIGDTISHPNEIFTMIDGYKVTHNDEVFTNVNIEEFRLKTVNKGDVVSYSAILGGNTIPDPVLFLYTAGSRVNVFYDGKPIYAYGRSHNRMLGTGFHSVVLPKDFYGHEVTVNLEIEEADAFNKIFPLQIRRGGSLLRDFFREHMIQFCVNSAILFLSFCILIISAIFRVFKFGSRDLQKLVCLSQFTIIISFWSISHHDLLWMITPDISVRTYLELLSLYVAPFFFVLYFYEEFAQRGSKIQRGVYWILLAEQTLFPIVAIILHLSEVMFLSELQVIDHVQLLINIMVMMGLIISDIKRNRNRHKVIMVGMFVLLAVTFSDIIRLCYEKYIASSMDYRFESLIVYGIIFFCVTILVDYFEVLQKNIYMQASYETLENMAYMDIMTGVGNRRRCQNEIDRLDEGNTVYGILNFDLNNLKKTNDQYGHDVGDQLIIQFARLLRKIYSDVGIIGRMGGDEFVVIIRSLEGVNVYKLTRELRQEVYIYNKDSTSVMINYGVGYCQSDEEGVHGAWDVYKIADSRMYCNKTAGKEKNFG